ncbi:hypothetical protein EYZ11_006543 [Aspergillus tanneri]|uniref:Secretory lipase n=1 Tax=Aspergillus tanneri TaxID=1220188 RepID=A0A4S3JF53_9EURO|nr:uncharacterized protein ATNIH1004_008324 [Aspergillus tanneri]KAA8644126.1 hypothetical protein ATNIH1004_008324 [Aspergillus tanneri]THC93966.1 hypothetical protein EYZ11_006543 [Aspergillus tanneri]
MAKLSLLLQILSLLSLVVAFPAYSVRSSGPSQPLDDPFYIPPEGFESKSPGTILRCREPPSPIAAFSAIKANLAGSYQILYRTTDSFGKATATVSTVLIPHNADFSKLLSYQVAEDAANPNCAPSYAFQLHAATDGILGLVLPQAELLLIAAALNKGWIVTAPDHLGPKSAFLANSLSGHAVLDNVRAALSSSDITNISSDATVALWGYSGGSLASGFAAELQPSYAPELKIAGAAIGGTVPEILPVIDAVNKGPFVGLVPAGIQGLANEYPEVQQLILDQIKPEKLADFNKTQTMCLAGDALHYLGKDIYSYTKNPDIFNDPVAQKVIKANAMGQHIPTIPLMVYKSVGDEVSPVKDTDDLITKYCGGGSDVEYKRDLLSEHGSMAVIGSPDAIIWLNDRFNGVPVHKGCTKTTKLTSLTDPKAIAAMGEEIIAILKAFLNGPIGPDIVG